LDVPHTGVSVETDTLVPQWDCSTVHMTEDCRRADQPSVIDLCP